MPIHCLPAFVGILSFQSSGKCLKLCFCAFIFPLSSFDTLSIPFSSICGSVAEFLTRVFRVEVCCPTGWGRGRNRLPAEGKGSFSPIFFPFLCFSQPQSLYLAANMSSVRSACSFLELRELPSLCCQRTPVEQHISPGITATQTAFLPLGG